MEHSIDESEIGENAHPGDIEPTDPNPDDSNTESPKPDGSNTDDSGSIGPVDKDFPIAMRVFGVLCIICSAALIPVLVFLCLALPLMLGSGDIDRGYSTATIVIQFVSLGLTTVLTVMFLILGIRLLRNKRHKTATIAYIMSVLEIGSLLCTLMLQGLGTNLLPDLITLAFLTVLSSRADPSLTEERRLQRHLRDMETETEAEEGTLGRDKTGKGFIALNFFNIFWVFTVCCILGLVIETIYHAAVFGGYQDRAGLLYGPFSPIYGFGGTLMTIALNRFHNKNIIVIFLISALIGGAFEFFTSWFMQFAFGVTAWDYTGTFLSIDGRTNGMFMAMWGVLGIVWIKMFLPLILKGVNLIPWKWRYSLTTVCAALMLVDGGLTLAALDCWFERTAGLPEDNSAIVAFCTQHYDDQFMTNRFQTMTINPSDSTRVE